VNQTPLSIVVQPANIWWIDITAQPQWNLRQLCELSLPQVLKHSAKKKIYRGGYFYYLQGRNGQPPLANGLYYLAIGREGCLY
jgi:hypothetical protein